MIDNGMGYEAASHWLPMFVAVEQMSITHPLRDQAIEEAGTAVIEGFLAGVHDHDDVLFEVNQDTAREIAGDVIEVLRGCAALIVAGDVEIRRHDAHL